MFTSIQGIIAIIGMTIAGLAIALLGIYSRPFFQKKMEAHRVERLAKEREEEQANGKPIYHKVKY